MQRTSIEWVKNPDGSQGYVFNPVHGCLRGCQYCYARKFARRFFNDKDFKPRWIPGNFEKKFPKKPSTIFVGSMSDIEWWETIWIEKVFQRIRNNPQHRFIFLTKNPEIYTKHVFPLNSILGMTVTDNDDISRVKGIIKNANPAKLWKIFLNIEPIQEKLNRPSKEFIEFFQLMIIGAETGNLKSKVIPEKAWIRELVTWGIPIFMKDNLRPIWGDKLFQQVNL